MIEFPETLVHEPAESPIAPPHYPVMLNLNDRLVVVIGGGTIAEQKVRELREAGARVRIVSPWITPGIAARVERGDVEYVERTYRPGDLAGARLAVAATNDRAVNHAVWEEAELRGVLLNAVDDVEHCHFIAPSVHRVGDITVTVSTAGRCPTLAVRLRERLATFVRGEHATLARIAGGWRAEIARRIPEFSRRRTLWYRIVDSNVLDALRRGDRHGAHAIIARLVDEAAADVVPNDDRFLPTTGSVALVGAGPGDAGLLTVRALERLRAADVVVYDRLVGAEVLTHARTDARLIPVGKHGHERSTPQHEIDSILVREARAGHRVVRLKGGDPFVFGRGAEEAATLYAAGVPCEVVPGISSAIAAPGAAGIPVTYRGVASGFAVVTGHEQASEHAGDDVSSLDWDAIARMPTVVVLMGLRALPRIVQRLIDNGRERDTPAAVIAKGTLPEQRVVIGTLATIVHDVELAALEQPATLVIGDVVRVRETLASFHVGAQLPTQLPAPRLTEVRVPANV